MEVEREVIREVLVEVPVEVIREVPVEVEREVIREVLVEVPVEVEKEVIREVLVEVPVEVIKEVEVIREVPVEVVKEVAVYVPVTGPTPTPPSAPATPRPAPTPSAPVAAASEHLRIAYAFLRGLGIHPSTDFIASGAKDISSTVYDVVIGSDGQGALSTQTGLAQSWEMLPGGKTHVIYLRQGIEFHNGAEVTAGDAAFSLEKALQMRGDSQPPSIAYRELSPLLDNLEALDDHTLRINCHTPCLFAPWIFSGVWGTDGMLMPQAQYEAVGEQEFASNPVGSGPYSFGQLVQGNYVRVDSTHRRHFRGSPDGGVPKYGTITFFRVTEVATRIAALKTGQADVIDTNRDAITSLGATGFNLFYKERTHLIGAYFSQQWEEGSPFRDIQVRRALNYAINREAVLEDIFQGRGSYASEGGYGLSYGSYPYDPERARRLLVEAGYTGSNPLEITLASYPSGSANELSYTFEAMESYFTTVGVKVSHQVFRNYSELRQRRQARELGGGWIFPMVVLNRVSPPQIVRFMEFLVDSDISVYADPDFEAMLDEAQASTDLQEGMDLIGKMQRFLHDDYYAIPLVEADVPVATAPEITHWDLGRDFYDSNLDSLIFSDLQ